MANEKQYTAEDYPITKAIPLPKKTGRGSSVLKKYPFHRMSVGCSFLAEIPHRKNPCSLCATANKKLKPKHFIARNVDGGIRVWRDK